MNRALIFCGVVLFSTLAPLTSHGQVSQLFDGKSLDGWSYHPSDEEPQNKIDRVWKVQDGLLVSAGVGRGYLLHKTEFENYELTLEWRSMKKRQGLTVSGLGAVLIHTANQKGAFGYPKSVEVSLNQIGAVYLRDIEVRKDKDWAFRAPDFADDVDKDLGEWNHLKLVCRGKTLTVIVNGTPVNQVKTLNRTKGAIALLSQRGSFPAPMYYRNIRVSPLKATPAADEKNASVQLAKFKAAEAAKTAAMDAKRREEEKKAAMREKELAGKWATISVKQEIEFRPIAIQLPIPSDGRELEFDATFGDIELMSSSSLDDLAVFYRTEMAKRGWKEVSKKREEDSAKVTFKNGRSKVELKLSKRSKGVKIDLDCDGLSFDGTNDPTALSKLGIPQPKAYIALQSLFQLPTDAKDLQFESGDRCLFKTGEKIENIFADLGQQLRAKGFRETRRPILSSNRRYTEFAKGGVEVSVNIFTHQQGSRIVLEYEQQ